MGKDKLISRDATATAIQETSSQLGSLFEPVIVEMMQYGVDKTIISDIKTDASKIRRVIIQITPDNLFISLHEDSEKDLMGDKKVVFDKQLTYQITQFYNPQEATETEPDRQWEAPEFGEAAHLKTLNQALEILKILYFNQETEITPESETTQ